MPSMRISGGRVWSMAAVPDGDMPSHCYGNNQAIFRHAVYSDALHERLHLLERVSGQCVRSAELCRLRMLSLSIHAAEPGSCPGGGRSLFISDEGPWRLPTNNAT
ncbi:hypothetical protein NQZ68_027699 [Dissostichus eleginoides]|nr:hypothetical protein NQZ68_027699 [Dissostichus eleginoides]